MVEEAGNMYEKRRRETKKKKEQQKKASEKIGERVGTSRRI